MTIAHPRAVLGYDKIILLSPEDAICKHEHKVVPSVVLAGSKQYINHPTLCSSTLPELQAKSRGGPKARWVGQLPGEERGSCKNLE